MKADGRPRESAFAAARAPRGDRLSVRGADGTLLVREALVARTPWERLRGLLGLRGLAQEHALMLAPCRAVHTAGMRFPLDLLFFARDGRVVSRRTGVRPWRLAWGGVDAWGVLEMQSGWFPWPGLRDGERLAFRPADTPHDPAAARRPGPPAAESGPPPRQAMARNEFP